MKLVCIDNSDIVEMANVDPFWIDVPSNLTKGKIYETLDDHKNNLYSDLFHFYVINDDKGKISDIAKERFVTLKEYRKRKLNKIYESSLYR